MAPSHTFPTPSFLTMKLDLVTVRVGEEPHAIDFHVYHELLTSVSPYFQAAFDGGFKEANERQIALTDVTEQTFRIFLQWVHAQMDTARDGNVPDLSVLSADPQAAKQKFEATNVLPTTNDNNPSGARALDDHDYPHAATHTSKKREEIFFNDPAWQKNCTSYLTSILNLFVLADKYSVHQLRDDIMMLCSRSPMRGTASRIHGRSTSLRRTLIYLVLRRCFAIWHCARRCFGSGERARTALLGL